MTLHGYEVTMPRHIYGLRQYPLVHGRQATVPAASGNSASTDWKPLLAIGVAAAILLSWGHLSE